MSLYEALTKVRELYRTRGFEVKIILMDNQWEPIRALLENKNIQLKVMSADEHVPEAEINNRIIKEDEVQLSTPHPLPPSLHKYSSSLSW